MFLVYDWTYAREYVTGVHSILFCLLSILCVFPRVCWMCTTSIWKCQYNFPFLYDIRPFPFHFTLFLSAFFLSVVLFSAFRLFFLSTDSHTFFTLNRSHAFPFPSLVHFISPFPPPRLTPTSAPFSMFRIPFITWFVRLFISTVIRQLLFPRYLFNFVWLLFVLVVPLADMESTFLSRSSFGRNLTHAGCRSGFSFSGFYLTLSVHSRCLWVYCVRYRGIPMGTSVFAFFSCSLIPYYLFQNFA